MTEEVKKVWVVLSNPPDPTSVAIKVWKILQDIQKDPKKIVETYHDRG